MWQGIDEKEKMLLKKTKRLDNLLFEGQFFRALYSEELESIINEVKLITEEYNVSYYVDNDFLETLLFNPEYTRGRTVIHLAENSKAVQDYIALRKEQNEHIPNGTLSKK